MTFEQSQERVEGLKAMIARWEAGDIALTNIAVSDMYKDYYQAVKDAKRLCTHPKLHLFQGTVTDVGYGCDRVYYHNDLYCETCDTNLTNCSEDSRPPHPNSIRCTYTDLDAAVSGWAAIEPFATAEKLESLGFRKYTIQTTTLGRL